MLPQGITNILGYIYTLVAASDSRQGSRNLGIAFFLSSVLSLSPQIQDATKAKTSDTVVFAGPPVTEQVLWPRHCVQESWGAEFHKDLKVNRLKSGEPG